MRSVGDAVSALVALGFDRRGGSRGAPRGMGERAAIAAIEVVPATPERWADVVTLLGGNGDKGCWCQAPRGRAVGYGSSEPGARREALRSQLDEDPPPGMLAYIDGEIAGWCGFGPRPNLPRLERSRTIPKIDDLPVWSILCFNVRVGYRRRGVAAALLEGVVDFGEALRRSGRGGLSDRSRRRPGRRQLRLRRRYHRCSRRPGSGGSSKRRRTAPDGRES